MVLTKDRILVYRRSHGRCEGCNKEVPYFGFQRHHIYRRSQYRRTDRDEAWNGACLCEKCHHSIHNGNRDLDQALKAMADMRKPKENRSKEIIKRGTITRKIRMSEKKKAEIKSKVKAGRERYVEEFKKTHNGLTPSQYQYRKSKSFRNKITGQK